MPNCISELDGVLVMECSTEGSSVRGIQDAIELIGEARGHHAALVVIPAERLAEEFFQLRTGLAGDVIQKFITYEVRLAILGDISRHLSESSALRDFVREANQGSRCWFVTSREDLRRLLKLHPERPACS